MHTARGSNNILARGYGCLNGSTNKRSQSFDNERNGIMYSHMICILRLLADLRNVVESATLRRHGHLGGKDIMDDEHKMHSCDEY